MRTEDSLGRCGMAGKSRLAGVARLCAVLAAPLLALVAAPAAAQVTVSITSTPANGTHYVAGEAITTRISGLANGVVTTHPNQFSASRMALDIGGVTRQASVTTVLSPPNYPRSADFSYTVTVDDFDTDGVSIPQNSISGTEWRRGATNPIDRDHAALPAQAGQQVIGSAASISSTSPAILHENNLDTATVTVALTGVTFGSGVTASSFELVTTMTGVTVNSVSSVSSGDTSATLTLASTANILAAANLAVRVLAAAHTGGTDLTTGTVPVAWVAEWTFGPGAGATVIDMAVEEGYAGFYRMEPSTDPGASCTGGVTIGIASDNPAVTVSPTQFGFDSTDWGTTSVEVTATAVEDDNVVDETVTISHTVTTGCAGTYPTTLAIFSVRMTMDDDDTGIFSIDSPRVVEGDSGTTPMIFTVTLAPPASVQATVDYTYALSGSATSGVDHAAVTPSSDTLTFAPGETSKAITVTVNGDTDMEPDEGIGIQLRNPGPSGFALASGSGRMASGIIVDDDRPTLTIDSPRVTEGDSGTTQLVFTVRLSPASTGQVTVDWSTPGGTAATGTDYTAASGTLTFAAGETSKTIPVTVRGDSEIEPDETVEVVIFDPVPSGTPIRDADGAIAANTRGVGTIVDDDAPTSPQPSGPNRPPEVVEVPGVVVLASGDAATISLSGVFWDPDGDALSYSAVSADPRVATATVSGSALRIFGVRTGNAAIAVTAEDPQGLTARVDVRVGVIGVACSTAPAQAPEGRTATVVAELAVATESSTTVRWRVVPDANPATADADAGEHGGASGEVAIRAGDRCADIEIPILDDADAEPAREWFVVEMWLRDSGEAELTRSTVPVAVLEGVCDRTRAVRRALLAATDKRGCEEPAPADLRRVWTLNLDSAGLGAFATEDLGGLTGLRTLDLTGNALAGLPPLPEATRLERLLLGGNALESVPLDALPAPERLRGIVLSDNALADLPADAFASVPELRSLRLDGNDLRTLPDGLFAGLGSLRLLRLDGNPGAPFALPVKLERTDAEPWAPPPATLQAAMPVGAPFETMLGLAAEGGAFADGSPESNTTVAAGETASPSFTLDSATGFARASLTVPELPDRLCMNGPCWQGFALEAGAPLPLFARPPQALAAPEPETLFGEGLRVALSSLAEPGEPGGELQWSVRSSDASVAIARVADGALLVEPQPGAEGAVMVEATATDANGQTATVRFEVHVEFHWPTTPTRGWRGIILHGQP